MRKRWNVKKKAREKDSLQPSLKASCAVLLQLLQGSTETREDHWLRVVHVGDVTKGLKLT